MAAHILTVKDPCPPVKKLLADAGCPIIVIADNTAYHTSGTVQAFAEKSQGAVTLAYLPRDAPEFNPDEQVWNRQSPPNNPPLCLPRCHEIPWGATLQKKNQRSMPQPSGSVHLSAGGSIRVSAVVLGTSTQQPRRSVDAEQFHSRQGKLKSLEQTPLS